MSHEETGDRVAKIAAKGLNNPQTLTLPEIRTVCGSALTQVGIDPNAVKTVENPFANKTEASTELSDDWSTISALLQEGKYIFRYNHKTRELELGEGHTAETALKALLDEKYEEQQTHMRNSHGKQGPEI